jgi:hypothetical protein
MATLSPWFFCQYGAFLDNDLRPSLSSGSHIQLIRESLAHIAVNEWMPGEDRSQILKEGEPLNDRTRPQKGD